MLSQALVHLGDPRKIMLKYASVFLELGFVEGALSVAGVAAAASYIAPVLLVIGIVLMLVHFVSRRRPLAP